MSCFQHTFDHGNRNGQQYLQGQITVCPNPLCREYCLELGLGDMVWHQGKHVRQYPKRQWRLIPDTAVREFPGYIPSNLLQDYREASLIRDSSPRAAATLARRCLQNMIRDFWGIRGTSLADELVALKPRMAPEIWEAVTMVSSVGDIGNRLTGNVNQIDDDAEPGEAGLLLQLIEILLDEWYVARHTRESRLDGIRSLIARQESPASGTGKSHGEPRELSQESGLDREPAIRRTSAATV